MISGFVISPKLLEIWTNTNGSKRLLKLLKFYESRVIRLAPTFAFTVAVFGSLLYLFSGWSEIRHFSAQSLAASLGLGNLEAINQSQSDYFRPNPNAFLHTWSLSVETQIYLLAPFLFLLIARTSKKVLLIFTITVIVLTLQLFIETFTNLQGEVFFLPISRLWEFLIGAALSLIRSKRQNSSVAYTALLLLLIILVVPSGFKFYNLLVVILTSVFLSNQINLNSSKINKSLINIGDMSYTLYLIHLPLLHLCNYLFFESTWLTQIIYLTFTAIFGILISKIIEKKSIQKLRKAKFKARTTTLIIICIVPIAFSLFFRVTSVNYLSLANPPKLQGTNTCKSEEANIECSSGASAKNSIMLVGDSHANAISISFIEIAKELKLDPIIISGRGCKLEPKNSYKPNSPCNNYMKLVKQLAAKKNIKLIVISQRGFSEEGSFFMRNKSKNFIKAAVELKTQTNKLLILGPNPEFLINRSQGTFLNLFQKRVSKKINEFHDFWMEDIYLKKLSGNEKIEYLSSSLKLCNKRECLIKDEGKYFYWDENHLSLDGADYLKPYLLEAIKKATA